jgi:transcriptional regulator with XRE-family HTH domain
MRITLGTYLRQLLQERKWTVQKLAKEAGMSHVYAGNLVRDEDPRTGLPVKPTLDTVDALSKALRVPYVNLTEAYFGRDPEGWRKAAQDNQARALKAGIEALLKSVEHLD